MAYNGGHLTQVWWLYSVVAHLMSFGFVLLLMLPTSSQTCVNAVVVGCFQGAKKYFKNNCKNIWWNEIVTLLLHRANKTIALSVMVSSIFSNLYEAGVASLVYGDILVKRSPVNDSCVIVSARKPVEFVLNLAAAKELPASWVDGVVMHRNTDGSLSIWDV